MDFNSFPKIPRWDSVHFTITQKIHGTNAQIVITPVEGDHEVRVGSRNRWITPEDDNFGFATWVRENREELIQKLGPGTHFGEWAGPGINSGEGLTEKAFILFDFWKYPPERQLPSRVTVVPVLYSGRLDASRVTEALEDLKKNGSRLVPGFMRPEGVVISLNRERYKIVFDAEETKWTEPSSPKVSKGDRLREEDCTHLCQPIRLEKLLSRDESYIRDYPSSLQKIVLDYTEDLVSEGQVSAAEKPVGMTGQLFKFIRITMENRNNG